jgi:uncharacterized membrane protein
MNDFITVIIIGVIVIPTILAILYTVAIVIIMYRYRRARRKREEIMKMLKSAIPTSMTVS